MISCCFKQFVKLEGTISRKPQFDYLQCPDPPTYAFANPTCFFSRFYSKYLHYVIEHVTVRQRRWKEKKNCVVNRNSSYFDFYF